MFAPKHLDKPGFDETIKLVKLLFRTFNLPLNSRQDVDNSLLFYRIMERNKCLPVVFEIDMGNG